MKCNLCGSTEFATSKAGLANSLCTTCGSVERMRVTMLYLTKYDLPKKGMRVLHFAPEERIARYIQKRIGSQRYETYDIVPSHYSWDFHQSKSLDLCREMSRLEHRRFDLIIHNHVMEHVPCNYSAVLLRLHRLLTPTGIHAFSVPIVRGWSYEDDLAQLSRDERKQRFGQGGHIRKFGSLDVDKTLGMLFNIRDYTLSKFFTDEELEDANIGRDRWTASPSSVFFLKPSDSPLTMPVPAIEPKPKKTIETNSDAISVERQDA